MGVSTVSTRDWVVGNGCRSLGLGSLGMRSSGSTLTCGQTDRQLWVRVGGVPAQAQVCVSQVPSSSAGGGTGTGPGSVRSARG